MASFHIPAGSLLLLFLLIPAGSFAYERRPTAREDLYVPLAADANGQSPQQVHISVVGSDHMKITWITEEDVPSVVEYGTSSGRYTLSASSSSNSSSTTYSFLLFYTSGHIHDVVIGPLEPNTVYLYRCGSNKYSSREFSFKTPPSSLPFKFAIVGDLGQTNWTSSTLRHMAASDYEMVLVPGDLSYADFVQWRWDSFGRLVEPLASSRPWMVTEGNHEKEHIPLLEPHPFKAYNARWRMPYELSGSSSNLYYSFDVAGGAIHVIMLGSYTDYDSGSDQYKWLESDLGRRRAGSWVFALVHAPWYNSNEAHQGEGEEMRKAMEKLLYGGRVDAVFAGHVHAYERFGRVFNNSADECGPVHITIGDGGNREGLAAKYKDPQPELSLFREASFGHGRLEVVDGTRAVWTWHRNDDDKAVVADQVWLTSLASNPACALDRQP